MSPWNITVTYRTTALRHLFKNFIISRENLKKKIGLLEKFNVRAWSERDLVYRERSASLTCSAADSSVNEYKTAFPSTFCLGL